MGAAAMLPAGFTLLQVTPALDAGGVERTTLDVSKAVVAAGGRSLVASRGGRLEHELAATGGELVRLPLHSRNPLTILANAGRLQEVIRREGVSIIHARSRAPAWSALKAAREEGTPFVTTYAGVYNAKSKLKRRYNSVMAAGDLVIANSDFTRRHLLAEHEDVDPARVVAIPRGVDLDWFDPDAVTPDRVAQARAAFNLAPDDGRPVYLLAGRLTRWKGQVFIIDAFAAARARGLDAVLVFAGDDQGRLDYRQELIEKIAATGLDDHVRLAGHVAEMPAAYMATDVALAPSLEPEAFGRTAVEPMAMGRPVLVSDHGAPSETVEQGVTGWRIPPGDLRAWTEALLAAAVLTPESRTRMGAAGRAAVRAKYGLEAMTGATLAAYADLLAARAASAAA